MEPNEENAEVIRSARHLMSLLTSQSGNAGRQENARQPLRTGLALHVETPTVQTEMTRSFPGFFSKGRGKRRFPAPACSKAPVPKVLPVNFYLLPHQFDRTPKECDQLLHLHAGLGGRTTSFDENATYDEICAKLKELYPKFVEVTGGWLLYKSTGGWGSRKLTLVVPDEAGYSGRQLKNTSQGGKGVLYIAPLQMEMDTSPLPPSASSFDSMAKERCQKCGVFYPLVILTAHIKSCETIDVADDDQDEQASCPICQDVMPFHVIETHASSCRESTPSLSISLEEPSTSGVSTAHVNPINVLSSVTKDEDWKNHPDPKRAASLYIKEILDVHETGKPLSLTMDLRMSREEQDQELLAFYKQPSVEWANPVKCRLQGDVAVGEGVTRYYFSAVNQRLKSGFSINLGNTGRTCLFEGETDHLVPSSSQFLIDGDVFLVAGRMLGHTFLHGGPRLAGVSRAVAHVLLGGSPETATVQLEDFPDYDIRKIIQSLDGETELSGDEHQAVLDLSLSWDLPGPTKENRKWLFERLLFHAVLGRRLKQLKQIRKGLKETLVWPLLTERKDVVFFPRECDCSLTPEMLLSHIHWPDESNLDEDDDDYPLEIKCRISGYLRKFIETASSSCLKDLVTFWVGWDMPNGDMMMEIVGGELPKSSTCFSILRLPGHYTSFSHFQGDLLRCLAISDFGFGLL